MEAKPIIRAVLNTMDTIAVQGIENMRKLLLCYDTLENMAETMDASSEAMEDDTKEDSENG